MDKLALMVRLDAKPGKEAELEALLRAGLPIVEQEPRTTTWFAMRLAPSIFGIFDTFPDEAGRRAHLAGKMAKALVDKAPELLQRPPVIEKVDLLASKVPR